MPDALSIRYRPNTGVSFLDIGIKSLFCQVYNQLLRKLQLLQQLHHGANITHHSMEMGITGDTNPLSMFLAT